MRLLDLFSGAGGAAMGYHRAGFDEIIGVDHIPQKRYPFNFVLADALEYCAEHGHEFDVIHASPPCPAYSRLRYLPFLRARCEKHPKLIEPVRELLEKIGKPYVVENTIGAPLSGVILCGRMFGLPIFRHRIFESNIFMLSPLHVPHDRVIGSGKMLSNRRRGSRCSGSRAGEFGKNVMVSVAGNQGTKKQYEIGLGIDWMTKYELTQAIPPAYTEFIGRQILGRG